MSGGVGHRCDSDPTMLWLWCRQVAAAPIVPLAWEPPYAVGAALKNKTKKERKKERKKEKKKKISKGMILLQKNYLGSKANSTRRKIM